MEDGDGESASLRVELENRSKEERAGWVLRFLNRQEENKQEGKPANFDKEKRKRDYIFDLSVYLHVLLIVFYRGNVSSANTPGALTPPCQVRQPQRRAGPGRRGRCAFSGVDCVSGVVWCVCMCNGSM